jgi:hypothetical protein
VHQRWPRIDADDCDARRIGNKGLQRAALIGPDLEECVAAFPLPVCTLQGEQGAAVVLAGLAVDGPEQRGIEPIDP